MSASVYTNQDPQLSNAMKVMVIMLGIELGAIDETHRHLKPFMEGRGLLKFGRSLRKSLNQSGSSTIKFAESLYHGTVLMSLRQLLQA
jgi:hypothetical protein